MTIALLLGVVVGAVMGLTGAGGGILAVPVLVFGLGWSMQQAVPVALLAVALAATIGAVEGWHRHLLRYRGAFLMAIAGMLVTPLGVRTAHALPQQWLNLAFAGVLMFVAIRLLQPNAQAETPARPNRPGSLHPDTGRFIWTPATALLLASIGAATGFLTGLLGVGGGFLMVPLLKRFTEVAMPGIVATTLMVIALVSSSAVISALLQGAAFPLDVALPFAGTVAGGMLAGRMLSRHLAPRQVQTGFAGLLLLVAGAMAWKALG